MLHCTKKEMLRTEKERTRLQKVVVETQDKNKLNSQNRRYGSVGKNRRRIPIFNESYTGIKQDYKVLSLPRIPKSWNIFVKI